MKVLAIVQQPDAGPGVFAEAIAEAGGRLEEWMPAERTRPPADPLSYDAVFALGGSMNVDEGDRHAWIDEQVGLLRELLEREVALLGLCLGGQMLAAAAGADPRPAAEPEIGWRRVEVTSDGEDDPLLGPLAPSFEAYLWHSYEFPLPPGAVPLARTEVCLQACRVGERAWAIQFHPELSAADAYGWIAGYRADPDAVRLGIDPGAFRRETDAKIAAFNQLGRDLCRRWLATV